MKMILPSAPWWVGTLWMLGSYSLPMQATEEVLPGDEPADLVLEVWTRDHKTVESLARSYDLWSYDPRQGKALVRAPSETLAGLTSAGLAVTIDYARSEAFARSVNAEPLQLAGISGFPCYRTVEETFLSLEALVAARPDLASWVDFGDSWEKLHGPGAGHDLRALVLTNSAVAGPKAPYVVMAAIHARELATAELATRFAELLVNGHGVDPDLTRILDYGEIHIIPQMNPDGRKKAETGLFWRKNVDNNHCPNTNSRGIDLNRNSTYFWGGTGSSGTACSEVYRGPTVASEPETLAIESYLSQVFDDQRGPNQMDAAPETATGLFISLHSFGELVLFPWEGVTSPSPNDAGLAGLARKFGFYTGYLACQDSLPPAAGTTVDVAYGTYGVAAYTFEIGQDFFESCSFFDSSILSQNLAALRFGAKAARRPYQEARGPEIVNVSVSSGEVTAGSLVTLSAIADDTRSNSHGCGVEPAQAIASASYSVDLPPWLGLAQPLNATDGSFNTAVEGLTGAIDTTNLAPGRHTLFVFAEDGEGRQGIPSAIFLDISASGLIFEDGFETGDTSAWSLTVSG